MRRSVDPRSPEEQDASLREFACRHGISVATARRMEDTLRRIPIERFLEGCFGPDHGAFYDPDPDLWIVPNREHRGPGFAFTAIRSDRSFFTGVIPWTAFQ